MIEYDLARKELDLSNAYRNLDSQGSQWVAEEYNERKLVRRIDRRILPLLWLIYFVQFMDKIILNACVAFVLCH
jgi:hypothetical protein